MPIDVESCYRTYGPMVLRRCRFLLKQEAKALDAMQDVFVQLLKNQERLASNHLSSLLYRMATNICLNIIRSGHRHPEYADDDLLLRLASAEDHEKHFLLTDWLDQLLGREQPSTRTMLVMLYVDEMTLEETARAVGLSVSGVRKRVREFKARAQGLKELDHEKTTA